MSTIRIENRQKSRKIATALLRKGARKILSASGCPDAELSLVLVDDAEIHRLNRDWLGHDYPTNVISFAMQEGEGSGIAPVLLGDVVISVETAARDAEEGGTSLESELCFLLLHGVLHLLGYDHERGTAEQAREMEAREAELFALLRQELPLP